METVVITYAMPLGGKGSVLSIVITHSSIVTPVTTTTIMKPMMERIPMFTIICKLPGNRILVRYKQGDGATIVYFWERLQ